MGAIPKDEAVDDGIVRYGVLCRMEDVLRQYGPEIATEIWGQDKFELSKAAALFLVSLGYALFRIGKSKGTPTTLAEISRMTDSLDNVIFLKRNMVS